MSKDKDLQSRERYRKMFEHYTSPYDGAPTDIAFENDLKALRSLGDELDTYESIYSYGSTHPLTIFMKKYGFSLAMYDFLHKYVMTNRIDYSLIKPGIFIVSENDSTALSNIGEDNNRGWQDYLQNKTKLELYEGKFAELKLVISPDATIKEITEFLRENKLFIKEKQKMMKTNYETLGRIRSRTMQERDYEILKLHRQGLTHDVIARKVSKKLSSESSLSYIDVGRILKDIKKRDTRL